MFWPTWEGKKAWFFSSTGRVFPSHLGLPRAPSALLPSQWHFPPQAVCKQESAAVEKAPGASFQADSADAEAALGSAGALLGLSSGQGWARSPLALLRAAESRGDKEGTRQGI